MDELERTYMKKSQVDASKAQAGAKYLLGIMKDAFPEAMVECDYYAHMVSAMPNDELLFMKRFGGRVRPGYPIVKGLPQGASSWNDGNAADKIV